MHKKTVTSEHIASYIDPISLRQGDVVTLGRWDNWDGHVWLWATASNSKSGWVPDNLPQKKDSQLVAAYDYEAIELTVKVGDVVAVIREDHGWAWCVSEEGCEGWIPLRNVGENVP